MFGNSPISSSYYKKGGIIVKAYTTKEELRENSGYPQNNTYPDSMGFGSRLLYRVLRRIICCTMKFFWVKDVYGLENIPREGAFVVAPNHSSFIDWLVVFAALSRKKFISFLIKEKYYNKKFFNFFLRSMELMGTDGRSIRKAIRMLRNGHPVIIFPEGTRTRNGEIGEAIPGFSLISRVADVPVIPMGIKGAYELWPRDKKFPAFFQKKRIAVYFGKPMYVKKDSSKEELDEFSSEVMNEIKRLTQ
ncbi:MAG: lysophospholipid acyltransferase family protein [Patescibacteria group bacterium]|nr:lysophospholipid acyltransferase family protein [Patescibacteria group bacterium]